jgi:hypothetical protein
MIQVHHTNKINTMSTIRRIMRWSIAAVAMLVFVSSVSAQEATLLDEGQQLPQDSNLVLIADVNITTANIVSLDGQTVTFSFSAVNEYLPVANVRYGVDIFRMTPEGDMGDLLYTKVFDETFTMGANDLIVRTQKFDIPRHISGPVILQLRINTTQGLPLAVMVFGDLMAPEHRGEAMITLNGCTTRVVDANGNATQHPLTFGIDIDGQSEKLFVDCVVNSTYSQVMDTQARMVTYRRTEYSDVTVQNFHAVAVQPGESQVSIPVPVATDPQSYVVFVDLVDSQQNIVSNQQITRYVVRGVSGSIQSTTLDQSSYTAGDVADVTVYVTGNADRFVGARAEEMAANVAENKMVRLTMIDVDTQQICGASDLVAVEPNQAILHVPVQITANCTRPHVSTEVLENGTVLDQQSFAFAQTAQSATQDEEERVDDDTVAIMSQDAQQNMTRILQGMIVVAGIAIVILLTTVVVVRRRSTQLTKIGMFLFLGLSALLLGAQSAHAATYSLSFPWYTVSVGGAEVPFNYYTITANTASNNDCELTVSMESTVAACNNDPIDLDYTLDAAGTVKSGTFGCGYGGPTVSVCNNNDSVTNADVPHGESVGSWEFSVTSGDKAHSDFDNADKNYSGSDTVTVQCIEPAPACGTSHGGTYTDAPVAGLCAVGDASGVNENDTQWLWTCTVDTSSVPCIASKPVSVCGNDIVESGEECDNGSANGDICSPDYGDSCDYCASDCATVTVDGGYCGNGEIESSEECDGGDFCDASCHIDLPNTGACNNNLSTSCNMPTSGLCDSGAPSAVTEGDHSWNWTCNGTPCSAIKDCSYMEVAP